MIHVHVCISFQACTLARRNADVFLKYMHRNSVNMPGMLSHVKAPEQQVKSEFTQLCRRMGVLRMSAVIQLQSITANKWLCLQQCFSFQTHCTCCFPVVELLPTRVYLAVVSGGITTHSLAAYRRNLPCFFCLFLSHVI